MIMYQIGDISNIIEDIMTDNRLENGENYINSLFSKKTRHKNIFSLKSLENYFLLELNKDKKNIPPKEESSDVDQMEYIVYKYQNEYLLVKIELLNNELIIISGISRHRYSSYYHPNNKSSILSTLDTFYNHFKNDINSNFKKTLFNSINKKLTDIIIFTQNN